jgi:hypothetical protein
MFKPYSAHTLKLYYNILLCNASYYIVSMVIVYSHLPYVTSHNYTYILYDKNNIPMSYTYKAKIIFFQIYLYP